jgi:hypothetical protein
MAAAGKRTAKKSRSQRIKQADQQRIQKQPVDAVQKPKRVIRNVELPSVFTLVKRSFRLLVEHKRLFAGITAVYGLFSIALVTGLGYGIDIASIRDSVGNRVLGSVSTYTQLLGSSSTSNDQAAGVYQLILLLIVSAATIWALRQVWGGEHPRVRDAYYKGMYPLIPVLLLLVLITVQLLPMVIGSAIYQAILVNGIAQSGELIIWGVLSVVLSLVSLYFLASTLIALYAVTIPDMTPMLALKSARELVRGRRWTVLRKILFLPLFLLLVVGVLMLPIILLVPKIAEAALIIIGILVVPVVHSYMYHLYRELLRNE